MDGEKSVASRFAALLAEVSLDKLSASGRQMAIDAITDTVGVTIAGSTEPAVAIIMQTLLTDADRGPATILGHRRRVRALDAAMINGTAAHAIDYDDMAMAMGGHPSVPVVPVILALGEVLGSSGRQILEAYVVGFEAECRMGRAVHHHDFYHYERGWHPTSTLGVFGAAAAAGRLLALDQAQMTTVLALAASQASGIKANFGTMTKPFHVGHCARAGLLSALLVSNGFTANVFALEHKQGFFATYNGLENAHPDAIFADLGTRYEIEQKSVGLKQFPCCGSTHPAIVAMLELRNNANLRTSEIDRIQIRAHPRRFPHTDNPDPQSALGAKFSVQYAASRALVTGVPRIADFEGNAFHDAAVRKIMEKISLVPFEPHALDTEDEMSAEVTVWTTTGGVETQRVPGVLGRGPSNLMSEAEKWTKFADCYSVCYSAPDKAHEAFAHLQAIDGIRDIGTIAQLL